MPVNATVHDWITCQSELADDLTTKPQDAAVTNRHGCCGQTRMLQLLVLLQTGSAAVACFISGRAAASHEMLCRPQPSQPLPSRLSATPINGHDPLLIGCCWGKSTALSSEKQEDVHTPASNKLASLSHSWFELQHDMQLLVHTTYLKTSKHVQQTCPCAADSPMRS